jgi:hypothetical protein
MGVANGERQIKITGRGAGVIEEARADKASYSSAYFARTSIGKGRRARPSARDRAIHLPRLCNDLAVGSLRALHMIKFNRTAVTSFADGMALAGGFGAADRLRLSSFSDRHRRLFIRSSDSAL